MCYQNFNTAHFASTACALLFVFQVSGAPRKGPGDHGPLTQLLPSTQGEDHLRQMLLSLRGCGTLIFQPNVKIVASCETRQCKASVGIGHVSIACRTRSKITLQISRNENKMVKLNHVHFNPVMPFLGYLIHDFLRPLCHLH